MVEPLMFPIDTGFEAQLNHSLLDVQIPHLELDLKVF